MDADLPVEKIKKCIGDPEADVENEVLRTEQELQVILVIWFAIFRSCSLNWPSNSITADCFSKLKCIDLHCLCLHIFLNVSVPGHIKLWLALTIEEFGSNSTTNY